jgi:hypothetical protein
MCVYGGSTVDTPESFAGETSGSGNDGTRDWMDPFLYIRVSLLTEWKAMKLCEHSLPNIRGANRACWGCRGSFLNVKSH